MAKDYYQILGLARGASQEDIKRAYRRLAHKFHPDKGGDEARFKEVSEAYQILSDADKRSQYDKFGRVFEGGAGQEGFGGFRWGFPGTGGDEEGSSGFSFDFDVGDIFEDFFGGQDVRSKDLRRGKDVELELEIPLEATLQRREEVIPLQRFTTCSRCQGVGAEPASKVKECFSCRGTGQVQRIQRTIFGSFTRGGVCPECEGEGLQPEKPCNVCKGEGRVRGQETIKVQIPAGIDSNQILKMAGQGEAGRRKGKAGDLYIRIHVKPHPVFQRKGDDLFVRMPVLFSQAVLGDEIAVPTIEGTSILVAIAPGTEPGKIVKVPGKGIPHFSGLGRGNMNIEVQFKLPKKLSQEQRELLERLKDEGI
jgi:molecular chaperone DnaJ